MEWKRVSEIIGIANLNRYKYLVLSIFLGTNVSICFGQDNLVFKKLPERLELSKMVVRSVFQDSHDFLWFGTIDGLVRYDGYKIKIYRNNPSDSTSVAENQIKWITEDEMGFLWIVNTNGILNKFDPITEKFQIIHLPNPLVGGKKAKILEKVVCQGAYLWLRMEDGRIYRTSIKKPSLEQLVINWGLGIKVIDNKVWIGTEKGLRYWTEEEKLLIPFFSGQGTTKLSNNPIGNIFVDQSSNLWVLSNNEIFELDLNTYQIKSHQIKSMFPNLEPPFNQYAIMVDEEYRLWIWKTFANTSISYYDLKEGHLMQPSSHKPEISSDLMSTFLDNQGTFWLGTVKGLYYIQTRKNPFHILKYAPTEKLSISGNHVRKIIKDKNGLLWIATNSKGLNRVDEKKQSTIVYNAHNDGNSICSNNLNIVFEDLKGYLWVGSSNKGLSKFDLKTGIFTNYEYQRNEANSLSDNDVRAIYEDPTGDIWIGTRYGLNLYQPKSDDFIRFIPENQERDISIMSMLVDKDNKFWLTTYGSGLYQFDRQSKKFKNYKKEKNNPRSLSHNNALVLCEDKKGRLWISTSEGLNLYHSATDDFSKFTAVNGFKNNQIFGMVEDDRGRLWLSTSNGLIRFNPDDLSVRNYSTLDGLPANKFTNFAYGKSEKTGELFFGGYDGLTIFHPDSLNKDSIFYPLVLSRFNIYHNENGMGQAVEIPGIDYKKEIVLNYLENTFTIDFATLEFNKSENIQYAYQLKGIQQNWVNIGNNRTLTFSNLNPGQYTLYLKSTNSAGIWNPNERQLLIKVTPPWWQTKIAYFIYFTLFLIASYLLYSLLLNRKIAQARYQQLSELDAFKTQFYTNITHEFRTPLTIISGMAEKLKQEPQKWKENGVEMIRRNSYNLMRLVNQLLDLQKLESGKLALNLQQGEVIGYLKYLLESFQSFAESRDVKTHFLTKTDELWMDFDPDKLAPIINNLLSNAIKFSKKNGDIYLQIETIQSASRTNHLAITIKDTGIGIPATKLPNIFDRFYQVDGSPTRAGEGTGIGLALTKELVHLLKGTIEVTSKLDSGTTFTIRLPIHQKASKQLSNYSSSFQKWSWETTPTIAQVSEAVATHNPLSNQPRVLIIEDNLDVQYYLTACLQGQFQLMYAQNGAIGIEKAITEIPDLIISDVMMPEKDGFEVCHTLKKKLATSHIPIVLLTAKATIEDKIAGLEFGADAYLSKPFHPEELLVRLKKLIELRKALQVKYSTGEIIIKAIPKTEDVFLQNIQKSINDNLQMPNFGPNELAKIMVVSRSQLHRKLKALTNISTSNYINKIRLQEAKKLLAQSDKSISEIAYDVGFSSPQYFSTSFSAAFDCSPSDYRERKG